MGQKETVIELSEITAVIVEGDSVRVNQLNFPYKNGHDYMSIGLTKQQVLDLAEELKKMDEEQ